VHDAGQKVLATAAAIKKRPFDDARRLCLVAVATLRLKAETVLHNVLPFSSMRFRLAAGFTRLPLDDKVGDFMRDRMLKEVVEVFCKQLEIEAQPGLPVAAQHRLPGTTATQRKVQLGDGQIDGEVLAG